MLGNSEICNSPMAPESFSEVETLEVDGEVEDEVEVEEEREVDVDEDGSADDVEVDDGSEVVEEGRTELGTL
jgi:hypothetical protein